MSTDDHPIEDDLPQEDLDEDEEDEDDDEDSDDEPIEYLATGRERRANQGNRMRALLEEETAFEEEEMFKEEVDDVDFQTKDEEDIFDSDFGSTDEGEGDDDEGEDAGEKQLEREAKAERKEARNKKKKAHMPFVPQFARQTKQSRKAVPEASTSANTLDGTSEGPPPKRRKISLAAINAIAGITPRESSRQSAVAFKKDVEVRLLESEQRRATVPKPVKKVTQSLTQADLIAEALETEEINRASLLAFYAAEEDRRALDRIAAMRYEIVGPRLTFLSRLEGVSRTETNGTVGKGKGKSVEGEAVNGKNGVKGGKMESGRRRLIEVLGESGKEGWKATVPEGAAALVDSASSEAKKDAIVTENSSEDPGDSAKGLLPASTLAGATADHPPDTSPSTAVPEDSRDSRADSKADAAPSGPSIESKQAEPSSNSRASRKSTALPATDPDVETTPRSNEHSSSSNHDAYSRNYVILSDFEGTKQDEMRAVFGDHQDWGNFKIVPSRSRVLNRKVPMCPVTGLPASYRDPATMTPYANLGAYRVLSALVADRNASTSSSAQTITAVTSKKKSTPAVLPPHFAWDPTVGAFTGRAGFGLHREIEAFAPKTVAVFGSNLVPKQLTDSTSSTSNLTTPQPVSSGSGSGSGSGVKKSSIGSVVGSAVPPAVADNPYASTYNAPTSGSRAAGGGARSRARNSVGGSPLAGTPGPTNPTGAKGGGKGAGRRGSTPLNASSRTPSRSSTPAVVPPASSTLKPAAAQVQKQAESSINVERNWDDSPTLNGTGKDQARAGEKGCERGAPVGEGTEIVRDQGIIEA
ncbi:YL1-domain-containing protein [Meredithblackwellia eburnea MCA 4105]